MRDAWFVESYDRSRWQHVAVGSTPQSAFDTADGYAWYATEFTEPASRVARAIVFAGIDDAAEVWLNGTLLGSHSGHSEPFVFHPAQVLRVGKNVLVIRVQDYGGPGGITKPITLCDSTEVESLLRSKYSTMSARKSEEWVKNAIVYEVYLRSFSPEGTFKGLENRLGELQKLGVTVVWLMPIHPVGEMNRKGSLGSPYAIQDYYRINPEFGTETDFRSLVRAVHASGMRIIIDLVANHTSWDSKLMLDHSNWFTHDEEGAIVSPNPDWSDVADLNYDHHELRKYMIEMMKYWVRDFDIDGYRCDVAELVPTEFWEIARNELDKIKPVMMLAEGTLPEEHLSAFDLTYAWNVYDQFSGTVNGVAAAHDFEKLLKNESYLYPKNSLRLRFNTNHDKTAWDAPAVNKFGAEGAKLTAVVAFTLPGVPLVYNGEEVGNARRLSLFEKVSIEWVDKNGFRDLYSALTRLRRDHPVFVDGEIQFLNVAGEKTLAYVRTKGNERVLVAANFSRQSQRVELDCSSLRTAAVMEFFSGVRVEIPSSTLSMTIGGLGYTVLIASTVQ